MNRLASATLALMFSATALHAQEPAAAPAQAVVAAAAPTLTETLELKRQNVVLRSALLQTRIETIKAQIDKEAADIGAAVSAVRSEVEKAHAGWTINDSGAVVAVAAEVPTAQPSKPNP